MEGLWFGAAFVATFAVFVGLWWRQERRREAALRALCAERGWEYARRDDDLMLGWEPYFAFFERPGKLQCRHVVKAHHRPVPVVMGDYKFRTPASNNNDDHAPSDPTFAVAIAELPAALPTLGLRPENLLTRIGGALGFGDITTGSPEFDRRFRVHATDPGAATELLHPGMIDLLMNQPHDLWEISGSHLLIARKGRWRSDDYDAVVDLVDRFSEQVPATLWDRPASGSGDVTRF